MLRSSLLLIPRNPYWTTSSRASSAAPLTTAKSTTSSKNSKNKTTRSWTCSTPTNRSASAAQYHSPNPAPALTLNLTQEGLLEPLVPLAKRIIHLNHRDHHGEHLLQYRPGDHPSGERLPEGWQEVYTGK